MKMLQRICVYLTVVILVFFWMSNWLNGLPVNPREENVNDISWLRTLYRSDQQSILLTSWNPLMLTGNTNILQRGYFLFAPLARVIKTTHLPVETVYVSSVMLAFIISGIGVYEYLKFLNRSSFGALIGAVAYMFLPPHITLGLDALEFNVFWAVIPFMCIIILKFIKSNDAIKYGVLLGILFFVSLMTGTTYFIAVFPFLLIFWLLQLFLTKSNKFWATVIFFSISLLVFLCVSAYIIIPTIIEFPFMWISQESQRKNIFSILSLKEILDLYILKINGHSPSAWDLGRNHPDMAFYLGWSVTILSIIPFFHFRKNLYKISPYIFLIFVFLGFVSLRFFFVHYALKFFVTLVTWTTHETKLQVIGITLSLLFLTLITIRKRLKKIPASKVAFTSFAILITTLLFVINIDKFQATYDHTVRVFIFPTFALAILAGLGTDLLLKTIPTKFKLLVSLIILSLLVIDLHPFSVYFHSIPYDQVLMDKDAYASVNTAATEGRYFTPFPYKRHLPKYKYEYMTHLIANKWRLNNENIYTPFTPLYSTQLYGVLLIGALEEKKIEPDFFVQILDWGHTNYVLFRKDVSDYSYIIDSLKNHGWRKLSETENVVALVNSSPSNFIHTYTNFSPVPVEKRIDPKYWYENSLLNNYLYDQNYGDLPTQNLNDLDKSDVKLLSAERLSPVQIKAEVDSPVKVLLVASEAWYPGWSVMVDNLAAPLVRANYASLGVIIPKGVHSAEFTYMQPWYYLVAKQISLLSLFTWVIIIWAKSKKSTKFHV